MKKILVLLLCLLMVLSFVACSSGSEYEFESGEYECDECNGAGDIDCDECDNTGLIDGETCKECGRLSVLDYCWECKGTGKRKADFKVYKDGTKEFVRYIH